MCNNAFKSLLRFLKENGFPYKCRLYGSSQFATNYYTVVLYYRMFRIFFVQKSSFATFGVSIDDFFYDIRWPGLQPIDKCIVLRIGTLTGCPLCRESHPLCWLKNPTVISIWLLVGFHPATWSVQSTPADNTRKRVWQYIEKERKKDCKTGIQSANP